MTHEHPAANTAASTIPTHLLHQLLDRLVQADLTSAGYRMYLSLMQRLMVQGRDSEAVGLEQIARHLGLSRNTTSNAMAALSEAGLIQRKAVRRRGAPTRTHVIGLGRVMLRHVAEQPTLWRGHKKSSAWQKGLDTACDHQMPKPLMVESVPEPMDPAPLTVAPAVAPEHSSTEPAVDAPSLSQAETVQKAAERPAPPAFRFDPEVSASMSAKIGKDAMYDLLQGSIRAIDPSWQLTDAEQAHYLHMGRRRSEPAVEKTKPAQCKKAVLPTPSSHVVEEVAKILPWLDLQLGTQLAHQVANQIAYQVNSHKLGRGDASMGVRAALSLVRANRWQRPHDMPATWDQAWSRAHKGLGDAQKIVH